LLFDDPINLSEVIKAVMILLGHVVALYTVTAIIFVRKDILS